MNYNQLASSLVFIASACLVRAAIVPPTDNTTAPYMGLYGWGLSDTGISHNLTTTSWLYRSKLFAEDATGYDSTWTKIEGESGQLAAARNWLAQNPTGTFCFTVAILPGYQATPASGLSLAGGAAGTYNSHFTTLANKLVTYNLANGTSNNVIIRLGHEFTGNWYPWKVLNLTDAVNYRNYWIQIVNTMRAVAPNLKFEWCGANDTWLNGFMLTDAYPGNSYVDYIGLDVYDECYASNTYPYGAPLTDLARQQNAWATISNTSNGLLAWKNFALSQGKPFTIPEWGLNNKIDGGVQRGGLDDPYFVQQMYDFIQDPANNVYYHSYFDVQASDGHHQLTQVPNGPATEFPNAAALFRSLFGLKPFPLNDDIGTVGLAGGSGVVSFSGAGAGLLPVATTDGFNFSSRPITGDDELPVKITSLPAATTAQTGVMLRQSTAANAAYAALLIVNGQCVFQSRTATGAKALQTSVINGIIPPVWLKLDRNGDEVTGCLSSDGLNWMAAGKCTVPMTGTAYLGVAVSSGSTTSLATATVDAVDSVDIQTNDTAAISGALFFDNADPSGVTFTGSWPTSTSTPDYYGANYIKDDNTGKGTKSVTFSPNLATSGRYDVYTRWPTAYNRAGNVPVSVTSAAGTVSFLADEQTGQHLWNHLGAHDFNAGTSGNVQFSNTGTNDYVMVDALMFVPRPIPSVVYPEADTFVQDGTYATTNFGSNTVLTVKNDASPWNRDTYLRYDVGGLSGAGLVQLQLTPVTVNTGTTATFTLEFVADDTWSESGMTWNTKTAGSGVVLGQLQLSGLQVGVPVSIDITHQVLAEAVVDGKISIRIRSDSGGPTGNVSFASRENTTVAWRPQLLVQSRPTPPVVYPEADAFVQDGTYATTNFGSNTVLTVKNDASPYNRDSFLSFDVGNLIGASVVQLQLTPVTVNTSTTATFTLEFVADDTWTESGVTWNTKPAGSGTVLGTLQLSNLQVGVPVTVDITSRVITEAVGDGTISIRIRSDSGGPTGNVSFASRENATVAYRPQLLVQ